jgi:GLPGLI family protein
MYLSRHYSSNYNIMKAKFFLSFAIGLFLISGISQAQNFEGKMVFEIVYKDLSPELKAMEAMMPKELVFLVKGEKSRMDAATQMGSTTVIFDNKSGKSTMLMDMMGQKIAMTSSAEEREKQAQKQKVTLQPGTKTIAGYSCKKAIAKVGNEEMEIWYTDAIPGFMMEEQFEGLKGFPLEYTTSQNGVTASMRAKEIKKQAVPDTSFAIPAGYQEMTAESMMQMMMGGDN